MDPITFSLKRAAGGPSPINYFEGAAQINAGPASTHTLWQYKQGQNAVTYQMVSLSREAIHTTDGSSFTTDTTWLKDWQTTGVLSVGYGTGSYNNITPENYVFSEDDVVIASSKDILLAYSLAGNGIQYAASPDASKVAYVASNSADFPGYGYAIMSSSDGGSNFRTATTFSNPGPTASWTADYWNGNFIFNEISDIRRQYVSNNDGVSFAISYPGEARSHIAMTNGFAVFSPAGLRSTTDGSTYTMQNASLTAVPGIQSVARKDDRTLLAFVSGSNVITVTDSYVVSTYPVPANKFFNSIAWDQNNSRFIAFGCDTSGTNNIYNSAELFQSTDNGATWTQVIVFPAGSDQINRRTIRSMINGYFVISGNGPSSFSTDLINWTTASNSTAFGRAFNTIRLSSNYEMGDSYDFASGKDIIFVNQYRPTAAGDIASPFQQKFIYWGGIYNYGNGSTPVAKPITSNSLKTGTAIANIAEVPGASANIQTLLNSEVWYSPANYGGGSNIARMYGFPGKLTIPLIASSASSFQRRSMNAYIRKLSSDSTEAVWSEEFSTRGKVKTVVIPSVQTDADVETNKWTIMADDGTGIQWSMTDTQPVNNDANNNPNFAFTATERGIVSSVTITNAGYTTLPTSITVEEPHLRGATSYPSTFGNYWWQSNQNVSFPRAFYCVNHNLINGMRVRHTQTPAGTGMTMFNGASTVNYGDRDYYVKVIDANYFELYFESTFNTLYAVNGMGTSTTQKLTFPDHGVTAQIKAVPSTIAGIFNPIITEPGAMYRRTPEITVTGGTGTVSTKSAIVNMYARKVTNVTITKEGLIEDKTPTSTTQKYHIGVYTPNISTNSSTGAKVAAVGNNTAFAVFNTSFPTNDVFMWGSNVYSTYLMDNLQNIGWYSPYETESILYMNKMGFYGGAISASAAGSGWSDFSRRIWYSTDGLKTFSYYKLNGANIAGNYSYINNTYVGTTEVYPSSIPATKPIVNYVGVKIFANKAFVFGSEGYGLRSSTSGFYSRPMIRVINHSNGVLQPDTSAAATASVVTHLDSQMTSMSDNQYEKMIRTLQGNATSKGTPTKYFAIVGNNYFGTSVTVISSTDGVTWVTDTSIDSTKGTVQDLTYNTGMQKWVVTFQQKLDFGISTDKMGTSWTYYNDPTDVINP